MAALSERGGDRAVRGAKGSWPVPSIQSKATMADTQEVVEGAPEPAMVHVWGLKAAIPFTILFALGGLVGFSAGVPRLGAVWPALALPLILLLLVYAVGSLYRSRFRWELRPDEVRIWRGILFKKRVTVPYSRIQNVNVVRGPLLDMFGLARVELQTAGHSAESWRPEGYLIGVAGAEEWADAIAGRAGTEGAP